MTSSLSGPAGLLTHDVLLHDTDAELLEGTVSFVERGLDSGARVLVHSTRAKMSALRAHLGTHERLDYGFDEEMYQAPIPTLFAYQRSVALSAEPTELWVTGTVPICPDRASRAAWGRYESAVNEVLRPYAFRALCTYDTRVAPRDTIAMARATHPVVWSRSRRRMSPEYQPPERYLDTGGAGAVDPPMSPPTAAARLRTTRDLASARVLVERSAVTSSAVPRRVIEAFTLAVDEVLTNALVHGHGPVRLAVWAEPSSLTSQVTDAGPGLDPLTGFRFPEPHGPRGLWVARQLCDALSITRTARGGTSVVMTAS